MGWNRLAGAAAASWFVYALALLSDAGAGFPSLLVAFTGGAVVAAFLLVGAARASHRAARRRAAIALATVAVALFACAALFVDGQSARNPLLRARFALSRDAFEAVARAPATAHAPAWIGWYRVERIDALDGELRLITAGCGVVDQCGFAWRERAPDAARHKSRLTPLSGSWYLLYDVF